MGKRSNTVEVRILVGHDGKGRAMDARYAGPCAGIGDGQHDPACDGTVSAGQRIIYAGGNAYAMPCADHWAPPNQQWGGAVTFRFTGRPVPDGTRI